MWACHFDGSKESDTRREAVNLGDRFPYRSNGHLSVSYTDEVPRETSVMSRMHITTVHKLLDVRIFFKECRSLAQFGHRVFLVAPCKDNQTIDRVEIPAINQTKRQTNPSH